MNVLNAHVWFGILAGVVFLNGTVLMADDCRESKTLKRGWAVAAEGEIPQTVSVPHTWNAIDGNDGGSLEKSSADGTGYWRGEKVYRRDLKLIPKADKRYFIRCEGAGTKAKMRVNGQLLGEHRGGFGTFCYEITPALKPFDNLLEIAVDNTFDSNLPPVSGDFTVYGGLYRPVKLIETARGCINPANRFSTQGVELTQAALSDREGVLSVYADLSGITEGMELRVLAEDRADIKVAETVLALKPGQDSALLSLTVQNPVRWQGVESPYLYEVEVQLFHNGVKIDEVETHWGFRTMTFDVQKGFALNGKPMRLRGVNRHQDREGLGTALSDEDHEEDIQIMREMGVTAWRAAHYPHAAQMYELCDETGIVVLTEVPNVDRINDTAEFFENGRFQLEEMVRQHRNHPCIAMWSLGNEIGNGANGSKSKGIQKYFSMLYTLCQKLDSTRPVQLVANGQREENNIVDIVGFNTYPGWYGGNAKGLTGGIVSWCKKYPSKPICVAEYGAGGSVNVHEFPLKQPKTISAWHPEEWQTYCHEHQYRSIVQADSQLWGSFVWNMFDFGADERKEGDRMGRNDKGLVSFDRQTRKDAFYFYQANWSTKPMVHINSSRFKERPLAAGKMPVQVVSNGETVELVLNGTSLGVQKPDDLHIFRWEKMDIKPGTYTLKAVADVRGFRVEDGYTFTVLPK